MSFLEKLFGRASSAAPKVSFEALVQDTSRRDVDRARDIAEAVNRSSNCDLYLEFRDTQITMVREKLSVWKKANISVDYLRDRDAAHTQYVQKLVAEGKVLATARKMQTAAVDFGLLRNDVQKTVQSTLDEMEQMKNLLQVMIAAENQMLLLTEAQKKSTPLALRMLEQEAEDIRLNTGRIPPENKDVEQAINHARNTDIARAKQQREAAAEAEASGRRIKLNEYLNTGVATGQPLAAPKTARFTRKPKPFSA